MQSNESKSIDIFDNKEIILELERLKSIVGSLEQKPDEKESRELTRTYTKIVNLIEESESKNYSLLNEYTDSMVSGAWSEEERVFLNKQVLKDLFRDEGWIYTVVDLIALKISSQPLRVYKRFLGEDGKKIVEEAPDHPFNKVIEFPNPMQDYFDWMYCIVVDLTLPGDAFLLKGFGTDNIYHLPSETMALNVSGEGKLLNYERYTGSLEMGRELLRKFAIEEIIHIRKPNPSSFFQGFSAFCPGRKSVLFNKYSLEYLNNYYLKGASSGMVLEMSKEANPANALRLLKSFEMAYLGRKNQRRVKILPQGVTAKNFGETLADQQLKDFLAMNKEDILALLKVPKHEVGLQASGSLGSEEYKTAVKNFWEATLKPNMGLIKGKLNQKLADRLGEGYFLDFDLSGVEALKDNEIQKGTIAKDMLFTHTINEVREKVYKMPPTEGGDVIPQLQPASPFGMAPGAFSMSPKPNTTNVVEEPEEEEKDEHPLIYTPEMKIELYTDQADKLIKGSGDWFERRKRTIEEVTKDPITDVTKMFLDLFADQAIEVIKNLDKIVRKSINIEDEKRVKQVIDKAIAEQIRSINKPLWLKQKEQIDAYVKMTFDHPSYAGDSAILDKIKTETQKKAEGFIRERNDYIFELLNRKTSDDIYRIINKASQRSDTITELSRAISDVYANPEKMLWRGERIARTEVLTVLSKTQDLAGKEASKLIPDIRKMWVSTFDMRTRGNPTGWYKDSKADHWHLHGQVRKESEPFTDPRNKDNLMFPRDPQGLAESVINCRCTHILLPAKEMSKFVREEREAQPNA